MNDKEKKEKEEEENERFEMVMRSKMASVIVKEKAEIFGHGNRESEY